MLATMSKSVQSASALTEREYDGLHESSESQKANDMRQAEMQQSRHHDFGDDLCALPKMRPSALIYQTVLQA